LQERRLGSVASASVHNPDTSASHSFPPQPTFRAAHSSMINSRLDLLRETAHEQTNGRSHEHPYDQLCRAIPHTTQGYPLLVHINIPTHALMNYFSSTINSRFLTILSFRLRGATRQRVWACQLDLRLNSVPSSSPPPPHTPSSLLLLATVRCLDSCVGACDSSFELPETQPSPNIFPVLRAFPPPLPRGCQRIRPTPAPKKKQTSSRLAGAFR